MISAAALLTPPALALAYWLWLVHRRSAHRVLPIVPPVRWPDVDVIVPTFDEARLLPRKLDDLRRCDYPAPHLHLWLADGGSTDGTAALLAQAATADCVTVVHAQTRGKVAQLNEAFRRGDAPFVLVTDADATMPAATLRSMVAVLCARPEVGVVGTAVVPAAAHVLDRTHWATQNALRSAEARAGHAGLVVAPCYLFRRTLLDEWPDTAVADDAFVTWRAAARGYTVAHVDDVVTEWRAPLTLAAMTRHKRRKSLAYLREVWRAVPAVPVMPAQARAVFLWRLALLLSLPLGMAGAAALLVALATSPSWWAGVVAMTVAAPWWIAPSRHSAALTIVRLPALAAVLAVSVVGSALLALAGRHCDPHRRVPDPADTVGSLPS